MNEISVGELDQLQILVMVDWRDGPLEGIVKRKGGQACWYFKLLAERQEATATLGDRLFALWALPEQEGSTLFDEYGGVEGGGVVWPPSGTLGSDKAAGIVEKLRSDRPGPPNLIIQSSHLVEVLGVWNVATD
ncbi:hypothetical protein ACIA8G_40430 [Lentzea sp. NPDC051213]|uniref:hypothetical protein n=1 Tax=Lentzea sp. NPDC051213 TaxID=3364126 RepID=UPI00378DB3D4